MDCQVAFMGLWVGFRKFCSQVTAEKLAESNIFASMGTRLEPLFVLYVIFSNNIIVERCKK